MAIKIPIIKEITAQTHYFGFVASNINGNYHAWSTIKGEGSIEESEIFFDEWRDKPETEHLEWYCIDSNQDY